MSKQDILDYFSDINHAYNESTRLDTLSRMLDELVEKAASPWHMVDEPPKDGQECIVAYLGPAYWIYEYATYHSDLNKALVDNNFIEETDGFIVDGDIGYARHGLFKYWMPMEPPKEDA